MDDCPSGGGATPHLPLRAYRAWSGRDGVASTGYHRTYALRLLGRTDVPLPVPITRPRARRYGPAVVAALQVAWAATNYVCAKRLVPFLAELVPALERHGHLTLSDAVRADLLSLSAATAVRLLRPARERPRPRGIGTTKAGSLLKHHVPIRTFAAWDEVRVGFMEVDTVAHCGNSAEGSYLSTLVLTDVATGWTECLPLLTRTQAAVTRALDQAQRLLPFRLLGLDSDNGVAFLNSTMLAYCEHEQITFTRGRAYRSNDQCFVEQKNGAVVRQLVGYDRLEGERAYRQLAQVYRAVRLYVNVFQPSVKLITKQRDGAQVQRRYDAARTPVQRLLAAAVLNAESRARLLAFFNALDPVRLLQQLGALQDALWRHAVRIVPIAPEPSRPTLRFALGACGSLAATATSGEALSALTRSSYPRKYRRTEKSRGPRAYRTRPDPFAEDWKEWWPTLADAPERTAKSLFLDLRRHDPERHPPGTTAHVPAPRRGVARSGDPGVHRRVVDRRCAPGQDAPRRLASAPRPRRAAARRRMTDWAERDAPGPDRCPAAPDQGVTPLNPDSAAATLCQRRGVNRVRCLTQGRPRRPTAMPQHADTVRLSVRQVPQFGLHSSMRQYAGMAA